MQEREKIPKTASVPRAKALVQKRFAGKDLTDNKVFRRVIAFLQRRGHRDSDIVELIGRPLDDPENP